MTNIFVNIPTSDLDRAKAFYSGLGWQINPAFTDENAACVLIDEDKFLMVLARSFYSTFLEGTGKAVGDLATTSLALISFDLPSREAVDELVERVIALGGTAGAAQDLGFMYQRPFEDPDGNRFEPFWMDPVAAAQGPESAS